MEIYNFHLANSLLDEGHNNVILVTTDKTNSKGFNRYYASNRIFITRRWGLDILSMLLYCLCSPRIRINQWRHVMIPYTSGFGLCAWPFLLFKKLFGFNYSVHCHGGGLKEWQSPTLQRIFLGKAAHVAAVSDMICREYSKRLSFDVKYLPPLQQFKQAETDKVALKSQYGVDNYQKIILFAGSIKPLKSLVTLLEAYSTIGSKIREDWKSVVLVAGDGPLKQDLERKYTSRDIIFLGRVPNEKMNELYKMSDIYVIPSWFEGTSLSLLEAMYNGLCCIGTNVDGIKGMIKNGETGLLFEKNDSIGLRIIIEKVLGDERLAQAYGAKAAAYYHDNYLYSNHLNEVLSFLDYNN